MPESPPIRYLDVVVKSAPILLRPRLHIVRYGPRCQEIVSARYSTGGYDAFGVYTTATFITIPESDRKKICKSLYIRAWVYNYGVFRAENCKIFVERILCNGAVVESERSPLNWTDQGTLSYTLSRVMKKGWYIDICASDEVDQRLQIISQKATRGYHRFGLDGTYTIFLTAEADWPCSPSSMQLDVRHDGKNWNSLQVVSERVQRKYLRLW